MNREKYKPNFTEHERLFAFNRVKSIMQSVSQEFNKNHRVEINFDMSEYFIKLYAGMWLEIERQYTRKDADSWLKAGVHLNALYIKEIGINTFTFH